MGPEERPTGMNKTAGKTRHSEQNSTNSPCGHSGHAHKIKRWHRIDRWTDKTGRQAGTEHYSVF